MPMVAKLLSMDILLQVGSCPAQLLFHAALERITAQNPPEICLNKYATKQDKHWTPAGVIVKARITQSHGTPMRSLGSNS